MSKLAWMAMSALVAIAGCASDTRTSTGASAGVTTEPSNQHMRGSSDTAPGADTSDRRRPAGATEARPKY